MSDYHQAVMPREVVDCLTKRGKAGGFFVDATLGGGGHSEELLRYRPEIRVMAFDRDPEAVQIASKRLVEFGERFQAIHSNFCRMTEWIKPSTVDGVIMDLGVSWYQLAHAERGFSFQQDGPLDMRMNPQDKLTAAEVVNTWQEKELARIFWEFGEERHSRQVARSVVEARRHCALRTTRELADLIARVVRRPARGRKIHPATRVFQAIRLVVNDELGALKEGLEKAWQCLRAGGRFVVISFHSLEDRIVKNQFRKWGIGEGTGKILNKKPMRPSEEEIRNNPRARSAKLRAIEKVEN